MYSMSDTETALQHLVDSYVTLEDSEAVVDCLAALKTLPDIEAHYLTMRAKGWPVVQRLYTLALKHLNERMNDEDSTARPDVQRQDNPVPPARRRTRLRPSQLH